MSRMDERAVARKLAERDDIEPPAGLLEKIRSEIPAEIRVSPELARSSGVAPEDAGMPRRQRWLIAASLVAAVGAGVLGWELRGRAPSMGGGMEAEEVAASAPQAAREEAIPLLKQAPEKPVLQEEALDSATEAEALPVPRQAPPVPERSEAAAGSSPVPQRQQEEQLRAMGYVAPPVTKARPDADWELDAARITAPTAAAPAAPPPPPQPEAAAALREFAVSEEITVTGVASEARSVSRDSGAGQRQSADGFVFTERAPLSLFGLNVGTASYEAARQWLGAGELPDPGSVRVEEWVNYFHHGDQAPSRVDFHVTAQGAPTPFTPGAQYRLVRFNIRGREVDPRNRVIAREARAQVEWNPTVVERYRLLGFENGGSASQRRALQAAGDEIEAGHSVTALYEIKLQPGIEEEADRRLATLRLRWRSPETGRVSETETPLMGFHLATGWEAASPAFRLAAVVAEMAEILAGSSAARDGSLDTVFQEAQRIGARFPGDAEVAEFVSLAGKAARLKGRAAAEPR